MPNKGTACKHEVPNSALDSFIQDFFEGIEHTVLNKNSGFWDRCAVSSTISESLHRRIRRLLDMKHSTSQRKDEDIHDRTASAEGTGHPYTNRHGWTTRMRR